MASTITCAVFMVLFVFIAKVHTQDSDVEDLLKQLRKEGDKALDEASNRINHSEKRLAEWSEDELKRPENQIKSLDEHWKNALKAIKEKAKAANVTIDDCLSDKETTLNNIPEDLSKLLRNFLNVTIAKGAKIGNDSRVQLNKTVDDIIAGYEKDIETCGSGSSSTKCLEEVASRIKREIITLPRTIEYDAVIKTSQITNLLIEVQRYSTQELRKSRLRGNSLIENIAKCVEQKIHKTWFL